MFGRISTAYVWEKTNNEAAVNRNSRIGWMARVIVKLTNN